jgi:hypothetical protein
VAYRSALAELVLAGSPAGEGHEPHLGRAAGADEGSEAMTWTIDVLERTTSILAVRP